MGSIERYQFLFIIFSIIVGLFLGQSDLIRKSAGLFIVPFLIIMLYGIFLQIPFIQLRKSLQNIRFASASIGINFIITPIISFILGYLFLSESPALWIGFIMLLVTPCTDWYLIFTGIAKGNIVLSTAILPLNLILQLILLPVYLFIFSGRFGTIDMYLLLEGILIVLVVPIILSMISKKISNKLLDEYWLERNVFPKLDHMQLIFLNLAIVAMFASQGEQLIQNPAILVQIFIPLMLFFIIVFFLGQIIGRLLNFSYEDIVSLNLTTLARNSPIALAIALTAFPDQPLIALALIIGPVIELPVLALISQTLLYVRRTGI